MDAKTTNPLAVAALVFFCAATILLIPLERYLPGAIAWALCAFVLYRTGDARLQKHMGVLLVAIAVLAAAPINTILTWPHFYVVGSFFLAVVVGPYLFMRWKSPGEVDWRFFPRGWSKRDLIYTAISPFLAWGVIELYFFHVNPDLAANWVLPQPHSPDVVKRLTIGINCVGIWDELFFVNTVYAIMRTVYPARIANAGQAVVYTSVLWDMAFRGWGPLIVYIFALTQGAMYERSRVLLWVLIVHLVVDVFLVLAILQYHYPDHSAVLF